MQDLRGHDEYNGRGIVYVEKGGDGSRKCTAQWRCRRLEREAMDDEKVRAKQLRVSGGKSGDQQP